jgi:hypothetical protein
MLESAHRSQQHLPSHISLSTPQWLEAKSLRCDMGADSVVVPIRCYTVTFDTSVAPAAAQSSTFQSCAGRRMGPSGAGE